METGEDVTTWRANVGGTEVGERLVLGFLGSKTGREEGDWLQARRQRLASVRSAKRDRAPAQSTARARHSPLATDPTKPPPTASAFQLRTPPTSPPLNRPRQGARARRAPALAAPVGRCALHGDPSVGSYHCCQPQYFLRLRTPCNGNHVDQRFSPCANHGPVAPTRYTSRVLKTAWRGRILAARILRTRTPWR